MELYILLKKFVNTMLDDVEISDDDLDWEIDYFIKHHYSPTTLEGNLKKIVYENRIISKELKDLNSTINELIKNQTENEVFMKSVNEKLNMIEKDFTQKNE